MIVQKNILIHKIIINKIDFHKKCQQIAKYSHNMIDKYCNYEMILLYEYFSTEEQIQLNV